MTTSECLQRYRDDVLEIESYITGAHMTDVSGSYLHSLNYREFVIAASIVRFSIAWESFLENIYCAFLLGEQVIQGGSVPCCVRASDEEHARRLLVGTNKYFDWTNPELIVKLSTLYLNPDNPIKTAITAAMSDLFDIKTIRNAAAHISSTTQQKLDSVASRIFGRQQTNIKVVDVIGFIRPDGKTMWQYYKELLDVAAENVAKGVV